MSRVDTYLSYLAKKPGDRFALYSLALEYGKASDIEAALRTFRELVAAHPAAGAGHYQHGLCYREAGRVTEAAEAWRAGLAALRGLTDPEAQRSYGEIERALEDLEAD
jgi:tetratricopeptide (TPR) repeat protein